MQKRYLVIFSLLLISTLIISGCKGLNTVGGNIEGRKPSYSATDSTYSSNKFDQTLALVELRGCQGTFFDLGYVFVDETCYEVRGCIYINVVNERSVASSASKMIPILVNARIAIPCAQNSKVVRITGEQAKSFNAVILR